MISSCPTPGTSATASSPWRSSSSSRWRATGTPSGTTTRTARRSRPSIEEKRSGHEIVIQAGPEPAAKVVDLMEALNASIAAAAGTDAKSTKRSATAKRAPARRAAPAKKAKAAKQPARAKPAARRKAS